MDSRPDLEAPAAYQLNTDRARAVRCARSIVASEGTDPEIVNLARQYLRTIGMTER
jgi:hypothetical protein